MYRQEILKALQAFDPISLKEMSAVQLMDRVDTKYVIPVKRLAEFLLLAEPNYLCQEVEGVRDSAYDTIYFDTQDLEMYTAHHNRRKSRVKVRKRQYVDSGLSFIEIKNKNNKGRTKKIRIRSVFEPKLDTQVTAPFIEENTRFSRSELMPQVNVKFKRITLVNREMSERLTIDFNIGFNNFVYQTVGGIPEMCIVEIKQSGYCFSHFRKLLHDAGIRNQNMSKYCLGTVLTNPDCKYNYFKKKLMKISKTVNAEIKTSSNIFIPYNND